MNLIEFEAGMSLFRLEGCPTAIAVPSNFVANVRWQAEIPDIAHTALNLSVYLPDISKPLAAFY